MLEPTVTPNGQKIRELRRSRNWTQQDLVQRCEDDGQIISKRTLENAEAGNPVKKNTLDSIANVLGVLLADLQLSENPGDDLCSRQGQPAATEPRSSANESITDGLYFFGFGQRSEAVEMLVRCQQLSKTEKARVICFTGHTLDPVFMRLLDEGVAKLDVFMGTKEMARRLDSNRQAELFDLWWAPHLSDLYHHIKENRITFRYYDCPPSFTGIALDNFAYLINSYVWIPTLNWLRDCQAQDYEAHWQSMNVTRRPCIDDYTVNACDMPSMLVIKKHDGSASGAFQSLSRMFELVWQTLEKDLDRPPTPSRRLYKPFEEMTLLQERLIDEEERKRVERRTITQKSDDHGAID